MHIPDVAPDAVWLLGIGGSGPWNLSSTEPEPLCGTSRTNREVHVRIGGAGDIPAACPALCCVTCTLIVRVDGVSVTLRRRGDAFVHHRTVAGLRSGTALAGRMGTGRSAVWRVLPGHHPPRARFVAALVAAFQGLSIDDLWEVAADDIEVRAA